MDCWLSNIPALKLPPGNVTVHDSNKAILIQLFHCKNFRYSPHTIITPLQPPNVKPTGLGWVSTGLPFGKKIVKKKNLQVRILHVKYLYLHP